MCNKRWELETSSAPALATHSSVRAIADLPRNMGDDMIQALTERGGVIQICFGSAFLYPLWAERGTQILNFSMPNLLFFIRRYVKI
jgi:microsomal dipeptidase-like Zn-dependent dipeptidase